MSKQKVLIIESEPWLGDQYQRSLEKHDFSVVRATHGYAAIDLIDSHAPRAIIMNLLLDGPGALGLLHELQSYSDTAKIPIIVCSSMASMSVEDLKPYGVRQLLNTTTMKPDDLPAAVRSALQS